MGQEIAHLTIAGLFPHSGTGHPQRGNRAAHQVSSQARKSCSHNEIRALQRRARAVPLSPSSQASQRRRSHVSHP
jgi:hypothetical protein